MALDGGFLRCLRDELWARLADARIDKIHQPSKEELVFSLRDRKGTCKLYLSARVNSPRVHLTEVALENPATPPMFCMLLRKRLTGARVAAIRQPGASVQPSFLVMLSSAPFFCSAKMITPAMTEPTTVEIRNGTT